MADLSVTYMGMELTNPIVVSASTAASQHESEREKVT